MYSLTQSVEWYTLLIVNHSTLDYLTFSTFNCNGNSLPLSIQAKRNDESKSNLTRTPKIRNPRVLYGVGQSDPPQT